jgi:MFS family permease
MPQDQTSDRNRWIALYVLCTGVLMIVLDVTVVNVALPSIQDDLGFSQSSLAWVVNAYLIAFGGLLLLAGRFGDLLGRKNVFLAGLVLFTVASLACGLAQSQEVLVGARFLQGVGGAMTSAVVLGGSIGLLAGGVLTQSINWHWIFFVNIPIGIATFVLAQRLIDRDEGIGFGKGADIPGAVLITSSLMLGVYTIVKPAAEDGWGSGTALGLGAVSLLLLVAFIAREATAKTPLIPLRIFRSRNVSGANVIQALTVAGMFAMFFLGALYLQRVLGYDALQTGLAFLPCTLIMGVLTLRYSEPLIMRFGAKSTLVPGLGLITLGLVLFSLAPVDGTYVLHVLPMTVVLGAGVAVCFPALMTLAMSGATQEDAGLASGLINTTAQVGGALGLAVLATVSTSRTDDLLDGGESLLSALTSGYHTAFLIGAALVVAAIVVAVTVLRPAGKAEQGAPGDAEQAAYSEAA